MKRKIALMLSTIMIMSLVGCGKKSLSELEETKDEKTVGDEVNFDDIKPEEGASLTYWTGDVEFGKQMAEKFEEKYGVSVTVEELGMGTINKLTLDGPTGKGADVIMCQHDTFSQGINAGILREFDPAFVEYIKSRVDDVATKTSTSDGKLYGVPVSIETSCLFYNKDIVGDKPATTLEQIMDEAETFNDKEKNMFELLFNIGDGYKAYPFLSAEGFSLFGKDGTDEDPGLDSDEFEKGLELIKKMHDTIPISSEDLSNLSSIKSQFCEGKVAYMITGPWDLESIKKSSVNFGVSVLPTYKGKDLIPFTGVVNAHVSVYTKYPIAAQLFATFLISDDAATSLYETAKKITTVDTSNIPELNNDACIKPFIDELKNSYPMPSNTRISYFWTVSKDAIVAVFNGDLTPKQGREKAVNDYQARVDSE